jgi:Domain of unknown function (DUF5615)
VAAFYADENFPLGTVETLRRLGHDVLTALEAGQANRRLPDDAVLDFARAAGRALLTLNRWHFIGLHSSNPRHAGIVACSEDPDVERQADAIDVAIRGLPSLSGVLIRVNRPAR